MKFSPWLLLLAVPEVFAHQEHHSTSSGRRLGTPTGVGVPPKSKVESDKRILTPDVSHHPHHHHGIFRPLDCNSEPCSVNSTTWTSLSFDPTNEMVVIPCGVCVTMDYTALETLVLPHGLDIRGTLTFPDGYKVIVETPFVRVQGNLEMKATNQVTDNPNIQIKLTNAPTAEFVPEDNNRFACTKDSTQTLPDKCNVGTKAFAVAGGKVDIRGLPQECPTWVLLEDVIHGGIDPPTNFTRLPHIDPNHINPHCRGSAPYMNEGFTNRSNKHLLTGGYGAFFKVTNRNTFLVTGRKLAHQQGPTWDMKDFRDCLVPGQDYLFSARIKLTKSGAVNGSPTTCAVFNEHCLTLDSVIETPSRTIQRRKGYDRQLQAPRYGKWHDFYATVVYDDEELDSKNYYQLLRLRGPEAGVDIEVDNVRFSLPPEQTVPDPVNACGGNLVLNGNAEAHPIHPYPITTSGGYLSVERQGRNSYFHHYGRSSNSHSVLYTFDAPGCLVAKAKFKASAKVRIHSEVPVVTEMQVRATFEDGSVEKQVIATCPAGTRDEWVSCESKMTIDPELVSGNFRNLRIQFETMDAPTVDMDVDDIVLEALKGPVSSIIVPEDQGLSQCWGKGAEILITSHTLNFDDEQVRRLSSSPTPLGDGTTRLDLDKPIIPPTTRRQSADFATEVALLSRNIVFRGENDNSNDLVGAHFIVMHTPHVHQYLEGVEFLNFGQQGNLGRYPIHFHMCGNVRGAIVSKNAIRESNQRCVVVHGTYNLTVSENVAYNTSGHCYIVEDGGEIDNVFRGNLGALTKPVEVPLGQSETDDEPSTFWCTNPSNEWLANVAAGSAENGFWFELRTEVRGPTAEMPLSFGMNPRKLPLKRFQDNRIHSCRRHGLRTYPSGYKPNEAAIFNGTKSFKNRNEGVFFHKSTNLIVEGGVLADNRRQADFDRADDIQILRTSVIGVSAQYRDIVQSQPDTPFQDEVIGLELHGFTGEGARGGATIRGVEFSGFHDGINPSALIQIDDEFQVGQFDYWTTLEEVKIADDVSSSWFDFRKADAVGMSDVFLIDLDSSMRPRGTQVNGSSAVVSNSPVMKEFIDAEKCTKVYERSYMYCPNTCLRSIVYRINPGETEDFTCRISDATNASKFVTLTGKYHYEVVETGNYTVLDETRNTLYQKGRYFSAALPPGKYVSSFHDKFGSEVWPTHVEATVENAQCMGALKADAVSLSMPPATESTCENLILNGDIEKSGDSYPYWLHRDSSLSLLVGSGIDGSNAIVETIHTSPRGSIGQFLDTRCLQIGNQYEVRAWVKLYLNGQPVQCHSDTCPKARVRIRTPRGKTGLKFDELSVDIADTFVVPSRADGWMLLHGMLTVDDRIANASSAWFFVERRMTGATMALDNVSVSKVHRSCEDLVLNGNFSNGNSTFWEKSSDSTDLAIYNETGTYALKMSSRMSSSDTPIQQIRNGCFTQGDRYLASSKFKLENLDGMPYYCDVTTSSGTVACPRMRVTSYLKLGNESDETSVGHDGWGVAFTDHGLTPDGWRTMSGVFSATHADEIGRSVLSFDRVRKSKDLVIANVSIVPIGKDCSDLIVNGDGEYDDTPRLWRHWINRGGANIELLKMNEGENSLLKVSNRTYSSDGIHQLVDHRCLTSGSRWKVSASIQLIWNNNGTGAMCNPSDTHVDRGCPPLRIAGWSKGVRKFDQKLFMSNRPDWKPEQLNGYQTHFTVSSALASCDRVSIGFRSFNLGWDLLVDDVRSTPLI